MLNGHLLMHPVLWINCCCFHVLFPYNKKCSENLIRKFFQKNVQMLDGKNGSKVSHENLVGGFNPLEKYARQKWESFPQGSGVKTKNMFELPPPTGN